MLKNSSKILFLLVLMVGTMLSVSSNSWLSAWMGLEINLLAFIPLMIASNNLMSSESSLKYFLTQALASSVLLFAVIFHMMKINTPFQLEYTLNPQNTMILSALLMKSGSAPFHFWFPSVMEGLSWTNALILLTWQKIAPLMLISLTTINEFVFIAILSSVIIGSLGGLNQTSLRKIMAFSSINHIGWMLTAMLSSENLWTTYFSIYSLLTFTLVYFFNSFKILHINQLFSMTFNSKQMKFLLFMNLLSLGGLPPFLGFLPKWMVIQSLSMENNLFLMTAITSLTLITLYFYIRLCYSAFMLNHTELNWMTSTPFNNTFMFSFLVLSFMSTFSLFSISLIYSIM